MIKSNQCILPLRHDNIHMTRELTIESTDDHKPMPYTFYTKTDRLLVIPRFYGISKKIPIIKHDFTSGTPIKDNIKFLGTLREDIPQKQAVTRSLSRLQSCDENTQGGYLVLPCGFGKTTISLYLISVLRTKTLVLVTNSLLLDQWLERIGQFLPGSDVCSISSKANTGNPVTADITVVMAQTLARKPMDM